MVSIRYSLFAIRALLAIRHSLSAPYALAFLKFSIALSQFTVFHQALR
jgi:hypothetical protein